MRRLALILLILAAAHSFYALPLTAMQEAQAAEAAQVAETTKAAEEAETAEGAKTGESYSVDDLLNAARLGDLAAVKTALAAGVAVDATDRYGATALIKAANYGQLEIVRHLISAGADLDIRETFYGSSAISWAFFNNHRAVILELLDAGATDREQVFDWALENESPEALRRVIAAGPIYASTLDPVLADAESLSAELQEVLATAKSRPDLPPPTYSAEELQAFTGDFENQSGEKTLVVELREDALWASFQGQAAQPLRAVGERQFQTREAATAEGSEEPASAALDLAYRGRAQAVEGIALRQDGGEPEVFAYRLGDSVDPNAFQRLAPPAPGSQRTVNWARFRGPNGTGIGDGENTLVNWNLETGEGVRWIAPLDGLANSSPVVWGDRVYLTTVVAEGTDAGIRTGLSGAVSTIDESVEHRWLLLAFDKGSGEKLWEAEVGKAVPKTQRHFKATQANSTPATDGESVVVIFPTAGLACYNADGTLRWHHDLGGLNASAFNDPGLEWGYASSPILHQGLAILQLDIHGDAHLAAWDLKTGELRWKTPRQVAPSWSTPALLPGPRGEELVVNGSVIHAYDPANGEERWSLSPNSELVIAGPVVGDGVVYVSAGYPPVKPIYAIPAGLTGELEVNPRAGDERLMWTAGIGGAYMPTPLLYRGLLYVVHHNGRLVAYEASTGRIVYRQRFSDGGTFTASPVAVNGKIYQTTEEGQIYVFAAGATYSELALHEVGEPLMATPAVSDGVLFFRTPSRLIAIGEGGSEGGSDDRQTAR
ncbi:MAG: PQQ-binding-like beta-propeller repeat protein [Acidobacteriota bacterium]